MMGWRMTQRATESHRLVRNSSGGRGCIPSLRRRMAIEATEAECVHTRTEHAQYSGQKRQPEEHRTEHDKESGDAD